VAETTARQAVALLREEGLVETVMGWGSFVRKDIPR
jgi:DNA-binding GntR family transcriptional regulator